MPELNSDSRMDKFMNEHIDHPNWIAENRRDKDLRGTIRADLWREALADRLVERRRGPSRGKSDRHSDVARENKIRIAKQRSKTLDKFCEI